ncbi:unnamed protein product [Linum tenue]|uniref:Plastid division protein CDP1, chloroplastic n=1 Tax=Linum tenue TaxID=586396 RepID=A0AAV0QX42_9ROSI|nr:unnamed protein product [Linum tenue]
MALPHFNLTQIPPPTSCCCCRCKHFQLPRGNAPPKHSLLVGFARCPVISFPAGLVGFLSGSISTGLRKRLVTVSPWILNAATPTCVLDNATVPAAATVEINVTCYQLVGLRDQAEKDEVVKSVIQLKSAEVEDGYTMDAIMSRKDLLMDVRDKVLFEPEYAGNVRDKIPPKSSLYIPLTWLPEVGEEKLVLDIGRKAIQKPDAKPYIHDILLSMALAECEIAKISFENNKISLGFEALACAQSLLRSKISLGKIEESMEELAPACTLEILSMPHSPENPEKRRGAIAALRELLRQGLDAEMSCRVQDWPCFLIQALNRLMATEIVDLLPWDDLALIRRNKKSLESHTQRAVIDFNCFYVALIAHIALGFSSKQTKLINRAKDICGTLIASEGIDLKLEEAFCLFLLGEDNEAQVIEKLQQVESNVNPAPRILIYGKDKNVATSVKSPVETWLKDSVLAAFSDTRDCSPSLTIKAEALGPEHQIQSLSELLAESMLDQWQELADAAHSESCYWRFLLLDLSIVKADVVSDGFGMETAEIEALLEEAAELVDESQQKKNPNYHSKYKIRYALKRQDDGSWRFCKCEIQSPS